LALKIAAILLTIAMGQTRVAMKNIFFKNYILLVFAFINISVGFLASESLASLQCENLFSSAVESTPPVSKYEKMAEELGLNYLKAPVPQGYTRVLISSRTYRKKDGTPGKTLHYYRYFRPDGTVIRPRLDRDEHNDIVARFKSIKLDPKWKNVWLSPDEESHIQVLAKTSKGETVALYHADWGAGAAKFKFKRIESLGARLNSLRSERSQAKKKWRRLLYYYYSAGEFEWEIRSTFKKTVRWV
jgi:hypothetical protein